MRSDRNLRVFEKTRGRCHRCKRKLVFASHSKFGKRGAWSIELIKRQFSYMGDYFHNLYPACMRCEGQEGRIEILPLE